MEEVAGFGGDLVWTRDLTELLSAVAPRRPGRYLVRQIVRGKLRAAKARFQDMSGVPGSSCKR